jgi:peptide deformylase
VAAAVGTVGNEARALANDLVDTMQAHKGCVGLAANQIGSLLRCIVVDVTGHSKAKTSNGLVVLFDPEVISSSGAEVGREGCLSLPDLTADVRRANAITVRGFDGSGASRTVVADAFEARALLHEIDHLDGILFLDRVASVATDVFRRKR